MRSDENKKIYLPIGEKKIYQVFIYQDGKLERAFESSGSTIDVLKANTMYDIFYYEAASMSFKPESTTQVYWNLDMTSIAQAKNTPTRINFAINNCVLIPRKTLSFNEDSNTVDLTFVPVYDKKFANTADNYVSIA